MRQNQIETCIESLCERGCEEVRRVIGRLESGGDVPQTAPLSPAERAAVLDELRAIMSVYDARATAPND